MRKTPVSGEPVFHAKPQNTRELTDIGGDQRGAQSMGMGCDGEFVGTDRSALEHGCAIFDVRRDMERKDVEVPQDGLDLLKKARGALTCSGSQ